MIKESKEEIQEWSKRREEKRRRSQRPQEVLLENQRLVLEIDRVLQASRQLLKTSILPDARIGNFLV